MQDEREPDLIGVDDEAVQEKVKKMMDPPKGLEPKEGETNELEASTAPEIEGLPKPKEPLKIKILKGEPVETDLDSEAGTINEEEIEPAEEPTPEDNKSEPAFEDEKTAEAVDDIAAHESDELLKSEDEKVAAAFQPPQKPTIGQRLRNLLTAWWHNPKARYLTLIIIFMGLVTAGLLPKSRYFLLNTVHVHSSLSLQVLDQSTQQPLKNVKVSLGEATGLTDTSGHVKLANIKLGPANLTVEKRAFAPIKQQVTIGWGSNPLGEFKLVPTGTQYAFAVTDYLSGKGIEGVEASSGEASALSDKDGKIKLTLDQPQDEFEVSFNAKGLREEKLTVNANNKTEMVVRMVPSRKEVFISKRSGKYDVYKIDIDGKNEEKILAGTGAEHDDMILVSHPTDEQVALVSTRDNKRNQDGFLLSTLTIIDLSDNSTTSVVQSERIQIIDWIGDRLVYVQIAQGASAANPNRHRLMSYNYKTNENHELASSNYFNDVMAIGTKIYYAPSSAYQSDVNTSLFKVEADGTNKQVVLDQEAWNLFRTSYDHLTISTDKDWYDYKLGDKNPVKLDGQPANINSRVYVDSPDGRKSLWVDNRDGKGVLLAYEPSTQDDKTLRTQSGLKNPIRWLTDNVVIYRINTEQETADYALSLNGGEPKKIRDVTNTGGVDKWYYY